MVRELTTHNLVYIVFRQRRAILAPFIVLTVLAILYCLVATPKYEGDVSLVINFSQMHSGTPGDTQQENSVSVTPVDREQIMNSYLLELQSSDLADAVIKQVGLAKLYPSIAAEAEWWNPLGWLTWLIDGRSPQERAIDKFQSKDLYVEVARNSNVLNVSVLNPNRELAKQAVGVLTDKFLEFEARLGRDPRLEFVKSQVDFYKKQVADAQTAMQNFQLHNGISSMDEERTVLIQQRAYQEQLLAATNARLVEDTRKVDTLQGQLAHLDPVVAGTTEDRDPAVETARTNLAYLNANSVKLSQTFNDDSMAMKDVNAQIAKTKEMLDQAGTRAPLTHTDASLTYQQTQVALLTAKADLDAAKDSAKAQQKELDGLNTRLSARDHEEATYQDLVRDYQLSDQNYRVYLQGVQQARIAEDLNKQGISSIAVFDPPNAPSLPAKPRKLLIIGLGALLGLLLGFGFAFLLEALDERLNLPWQVASVLEIPVLGSMGTIGGAVE